MDFTANLIAAAAGMFESKLFSTGGDEVNVNCYTHDQETQQALLASGKTLEEALDAFTQRTHSVLLGAGKTPVVWEGEDSRCCTAGSTADDR